MSFSRTWNVGFAVLARSLVLTLYLDFNLNSELIGLNAAIISAGCIIGAPIVGPIVDRWGRKIGLAMGSISIIVGVILQASAAKSK